MHIPRVSCQKGPTRHAYAWQIGPFGRIPSIMWWRDDDARHKFWVADSYFNEHKRKNAIITCKRSLCFHRRCLFDFQSANNIAVKRIGELCGYIQDESKMIQESFEYLLSVGVLCFQWHYWKRINGFWYHFLGTLEIIKAYFLYSWRWWELPSGPGFFQ